MGVDGSRAERESAGLMNLSVNSLLLRVLGGSSAYA